MSTLQKTLAERQQTAEADAHLCYAAGAQCPALLVHTWAGASWALPWSHFVGAQHEQGEDGERLSLAFSGHEVVAEGVRLRLLLEMIATFRLESLRDLPANYRAQRGETEPFVTKLVVRVRATADAPKQDEPA